MCCMSCRRNATQSAPQPCPACSSSLVVCAKSQTQEVLNINLFVKSTVLKQLTLSSMVCYMFGSATSSRSRAADLLELAVRGDLKLLETPLESSFTERFKYHATHHSQIVRLGRVQSSDTSKLRYKVLPIPPARLHLYILSV